jgi:adenine phosphoribosyltransferase
VTPPVDLDAAIRKVPDHPTPGILFYDLMPMFADAAALGHAVELLAEWARPLAPDVILCPESRGFILGGALAHALGAGFISARKAGRLPGQTVRHEYALEYGLDVLEMHADALLPGQRVLVHDDLLATGGTAAAAIALAEGMGATVVGIGVVVELTFLPGRERLAPHEVRSLVTYSSEAVPT